MFLNYINSFYFETIQSCHLDNSRTIVLLVYQKCVTFICPSFDFTKKYLLFVCFHMSSLVTVTKLPTRFVNPPAPKIFSKMIFSLQTKFNPIQPNATQFNPIQPNSTQVNPSQKWGLGPPPKKIPPPKKFQK